MALKKTIYSTATVAGFGRFPSPELMRFSEDLGELIDQMLKYEVSTMKAAQRKQNAADTVLNIRALEASEPDPAKVVRDARAEMGLTQVDFATLVGVAGNTVARWERGEAGVKKSTLKLIRMLAAAGPTRKAE